MSQGIPPGYVLPTPQRAKLVGTLNIVFAALLLVYILFQIAMIFASPVLMQMSGDVLKQAQAKADEQRKAELEALKQEAAQAKTAEEKAQIELRRSTLEKTPQVTMPDMSKVTDMMKAPAYQAYVWTDMVSGLVLNVAMLISGIGLLGLPVANGQKTTLSRRPSWTERAKLRTAEVLAHLEGVLAVGVDVLVTAR